MGFTSERNGVSSPETVNIEIVQENYISRYINLKKYHKHIYK